MTPPHDPAGVGNPLLGCAYWWTTIPRMFTPSRMSW